MKLRQDLRDLEVDALVQLPVFLSYFNYDLACAVAESLAGMDTHVRAVYTFEPEENAVADVEKTSPATIDVGLLVHVKRINKETKKFVASLDEMLSTALREMYFHGVLHHESILNCRWVTDEDVKHGVGDAVLLRSLFTPPLQIWAQEG